MSFSDWSKKQKILLAVLSGALLFAAVLLIMLVTRPAVPVSLPDASAVSGSVNRVDEQTIRLDPDRTPPPDLALEFRPDPECPLMDDGAVLNRGEPFPIGGSVCCNYPLESVAVSISCLHNNSAPYPFRSSVHFKNIRTGVYSLTDMNTDEGVSLASLVDFSNLQTGVHTLKISAGVSGSRTIEVLRRTFYVVGGEDEWETITIDCFPDSYPEALAFFGEPERFLYRYQWVNGRYILADPEWEKTYITAIPGYPDGEPWRMHVDAVPYFETAFEYLNGSVLRVHGTNGDTGLIRACDLITEYNGCYVSRFTSGLKAISHHTFGTAVDVNASMEPNKNADVNTALIYDDVHGHLVYNGILEAGGVPYYDFTYDGAYEPDPNGVPETCVNYLLFELGFFRAGFDWAYYYRSTSDAMHFCLSEFVTYKHTDLQYGLRKVFEYADPVDPGLPLPVANP